MTRFAGHIFASVSLFPLCADCKSFRQMEDIFLQEQGIEVFVLEPFKGKPFEPVGPLTFLNGKGIAPGEQIRAGNVHQKINAQLVEVLMIHILCKEGLIQPQWPLDVCGDVQFFLNLPDDSLFRGFSQTNPSAGKIEIGRTFIMHSQDVSVMHDHGADTVIKPAVVCLKRNIHL